MFARSIIRMAFETEFVVGMQVNAFQKIGHQPMKVLWRKKCRRTSPEMDLPNLRLPPEEIPVVIPFLQYRPDIRNFYQVIFGDTGIARTIRAEILAEGQMKIQ